MSEYLLNIVLVPVVFGAILGVLRPKGLPGLAFLTPLVLMAIVWTTVFGYKMHKTLGNLWNYQLGLDGERFVGEELNGLLADGFRVYHDLPFNGFNIDHVAVGPQGVFAVETKTRRKPVDPTGKKKYVVRFDGSSLDWGWGRETDGLEQAANNGRTLSRWLSSAVGRSISVTSILTLPGWWVDRERPCQRVQVLNPKEIIGFCKRSPRILDEELITRICHQLDQKSRMEIA